MHVSYILYILEIAKLTWTAAGLFASFRPHLRGPRVHRALEGDHAADGDGQLGITAALLREISVLVSADGMGKTITNIN